MANNSDRARCLDRVASVMGDPVADTGLERDVFERLYAEDWHPHYIGRVVAQVREWAPQNAFVRELGNALKRDPVPDEIEYANGRRLDGASVHEVATELREDDEGIATRNPPRSAP